MGVRQTLQEKQKATTVIAGVVLGLAVLALVYENWPAKNLTITKLFYSDDDGQTWFADGVFLVPPYEHNGKIAVDAQVYSYDGGKKQFCAYLAKYRTEAQKQLLAAIADARQHGKALDSIQLFSDPGFIGKGMMIKLPGPGHSWIAWDAPESADIFAIHSPDGSPVDQCFAE